MRATAAGTSRQNTTPISQPTSSLSGWERVRPWVITIAVTSLVTATALFASGVKLSPPFDILPTALLVFLLILMGLLLLVGILSVYHWHADRQAARDVRDPYFDDREDYYGEEDSVAPNRTDNRLGGSQPQLDKSLGQPGSSLVGVTAANLNNAQATISANAGGANFIIDPNQRPTQLLMVNPDLDPQISTWEAIEQQYQLRQQQLLLSSNTNGGNGQMLPGVRGPQQQQNYYRQQQGGM